jgi:Major Facilitator Superfamily
MTLYLLLDCYYMHRSSAFVGQCMILSSPALGVLVDRFGPTALTAFMGLSGIFGTAMLLAAVAIPRDNLLFVAFICIGLMATAASILTVKTGMVFADETTPTPAAKAEAEAATNNSKDDDHDIVDDHHGNHEGSAATDNIMDNNINNKQKNASKPREDMGQSRVISLLNALFDAGSVTYLGLWGISELGPSISAVFGMYLVLAVVCFGGALLFWLALGDQAFPSSLVTAPDRRINLDTMDTTTLSKDIEATKDNGSEREGSAQVVPDEAAAKLDLNTDACAQETTPEYVPVCERTPKDQLLSLPFAMLVFYFATNVALNQFVLTTTRDYLEYLDETKSKQYLAIFTLLMPVSILGIPFTDQMIARYGYHAGFQTVLLLAAVHGIIITSCDQLNGVQIFGFVVFSFYRCFLFSIVFSYVPTLLSGDVVGKGVGAMHFVAGVFSFCNIPLANLAVTELDGNFFIPNLLYTLLVIPCSVAAWMIGRSIQRETLIKQTREQQHYRVTH